MSEKIIFKGYKIKPFNSLKEVKEHKEEFEPLSQITTVSDNDQYVLLISQDKRNLFRYADKDGVFFTTVKF